MDFKKLIVGILIIGALSICAWLAVPKEILEAPWMRVLEIAAVAFATYRFRNYLAKTNSAVAARSALLPKNDLLLWAGGGLLIGAVCWLEISSWVFASLGIPDATAAGWTVLPFLVIVAAGLSAITIWAIIKWTTFVR